MTSPTDNDLPGGSRPRAAALATTDLATTDLAIAREVLTTEASGLSALAASLDGSFARAVEAG